MDHAPDAGRARAASLLPKFLYLAISRELSRDDTSLKIASCPVTAVTTVLPGLSPPLAALFRSSAVLPFCRAPGAERGTDPIPPPCQRTIYGDRIGLLSRAATRLRFVVTTIRGKVTAIYHVVTTIYSGKNVVICRYIIYKSWKSWKSPLHLHPSYACTRAPTRMYAHTRPSVQKHGDNGDFRDNAHEPENSEM